MTALDEGALLLSLATEQRQVLGRELDSDDMKVLEMFLSHPNRSIVDDGTHLVSAQMFRRFCKSEKLSALRKMSPEFEQEFLEKKGTGNYLTSEFVNILMARFEISAHRILGEDADFKCVTPNVSFQILQNQNAKYQTRGKFREMLTELFSGNRVLLPFSEMSHWSLFEILNSEKKVHYYDSLPGYLSDEFLDGVFNKIVATLLALGITQKGETWKFEKNIESLRQPNTEDCGVFTLYFVALRMLDLWDVDTVLQTQSLRMTLAKGLLWQSRSF